MNLKFKPAPIILFVYARPRHTQKTISALSENHLAIHSDLIVYADSARGDRDKELVAEVRSIIKNLNGFKSVTLNVRSKNFGLAKNIIDGVSEVCGQFGRAIVLEDDIVTSPHFLTYMNDALNMYESVESVYSISGCNYPVDLCEMESQTYFLRLPLCWGWATWDKEWKYFEKDLREVRRIDKSLVRYMNFDGAYDFFRQATMNYKGQLDTWFVFWYLSLAKRRGLVLFPKDSLVVNIGHDGTGENSVKSKKYVEKSSLNAIEVLDIEVVESLYAFKQHQMYFIGIRKTLKERIFGKIMKILSTLWS
jgi:hypothetical protein